MNDRLTTPGGWSIPHDTGVDWETVFLQAPITIPEVSVARGGITYPRPPEPGTKAYAEWKADQDRRERIQAWIRRRVGNILIAQNAAIDSAVLTALVEGYEVHVQRRYDSRFIGIELSPRHPESPLLNEHHDDYHWERDEDD